MVTSSVFTFLLTTFEWCGDFLGLISGFASNPFTHFLNFMEADGFVGLYDVWYTNFFTGEYVYKTFNVTESVAGQVLFSVFKVAWEIINPIIYPIYDNMRDMPFIFVFLSCWAVLFFIVGLIKLLKGLVD